MVLGANDLLISFESKFKRKLTRMICIDPRSVPFYQVSETMLSCRQDFPVRGSQVAN